MLQADSWNQESHGFIRGECQMAMPTPRVKICGLTRLDQCLAIAALGVHALGFIGVPTSKRYVPLEHLAELTQDLPPFISRIGVFADADLEGIVKTVRTGGLTGVQLHGQESPEYCARLRELLPSGEIIKALRLQAPKQLQTLDAYAPYTTAFLLDAYHPQQLGGTGQTLDWRQLEDFKPPRPWILAGGLTPENIAEALTLLTPQAVDLSSGVERAPGDKAIERVVQLLARLRTLA
ncbi:phosphoribosylanthranilate isomerase [Anthocerotibacter panamensis]|uniref:phosphoribosylanthranilate isomerase n=1 Tax=Anthocerotibacter panamensis TaxID=2857077 RepID=UPI001FD8E0B2|nr:phosphoribosylanthranilate isomerase [Anthocerotibacter panamensis]